MPARPNKVWTCRCPGSQPKEQHWARCCHACGMVAPNMRQCEDCGAVVRRAGWAAHRKSLGCQADQTVRRYAQAGKVPVGTYWAVDLSECQIPYLKAEVSYRKRGWGPGRTSYGLYVDRWVADVVNLGFDNVDVGAILRCPLAATLVGPAILLGADAQQILALLGLRDMSEAEAGP